MTKKSNLKSLSKNPWAISTAVLLVLVIVLVSINFTSVCTGKVVSAKTAGQNLLEFANNQGADADLIGVTEEESFYEVVLSIQGQELPLYVTKDGEYFAQAIIPLITTPTTDTQPTTEIPKTNKPSVELFVWAYCPYGVQAQGPMAEVANLLGDYAEFTIVPYYDGHGPFETQENKIESCIQSIEPEKYWSYAAGFVENIYPKCSQERTEECDLTEAKKLMNSLGINTNEVLACVESNGESLNAAASQKAQANGVTGSPTILINGVKANVARNADAIKEAVCSAFNDAPEVCLVQLDSSSTATSGNC